MAVCVGALFAIAVASPVYADSPSGKASKGDGTTAVIGGREYGPKEGLAIDTVQIELGPGSGLSASCLMTRPVGSAV